MATKKTTVKANNSTSKPGDRDKITLPEKSLEKQPEKPAAIQTVSSDNSEFACFLDTAKFNQLYRAANLFASSQLVPAHYQNKPQNCFVAMQMAMRLAVDPMMFMQNTYIVHGTPGMEAKLVIALINSKGPFEGPIQWKQTGEGDKRECTAYAKHKVTGEVCEATVSWKMATAEGWTGKTGSKWKTMPDLMFKYRSAVFLGRLYCPECLMGMSTVDELVDIKANNEKTEGVGEAGVVGLKQRLSKPVESTEVIEPEVAPEPSKEEIEADDKLADEQFEKVGTDAPEPLDEPDPVLGKPDAETEEQKPLRYYCGNCENESDKLAPNNLCRKCLTSDKIIDRRTS